MKIKPTMPRVMESSSITLPLLITFIISGLIYPIIYQRGLFADGAFHLLNTLSTGWFLPDRLRYSVLIFIQGPTLFSIYGLGLNSVRDLCWIYVGSQFFIPWLILFLATYFLPADRRSVALLPIIFLIFSYFLSSVFSVSEVFTASSFWWAILLFIIGRELRFRGAFANFTALSFMLLIVCSYEPVASLTILLVPLLLARNLKTVLATKRLDLIILLSLMTLILCVSCAIGTYSTLYSAIPHRQNVLTNGLSSIRAHMKSYPVQICLTTIVAGIALLFIAFSNSKNAKLYRTALWILYTTAIGAISYQAPTVVPWLQFEARLFIPILMIIFSAFVLIVQFALDHKWLQIKSISTELLPLVISLAVIHGWWQFSATNEWQKYVSQIQSERVQGRAVNVTEQLASNPFKWDWAVPSLSIMITAMEHSNVDNIVYVDTKSGWQLFNPACSKSWPSMKWLGISYSLESDACP